MRKNPAYIFIPVKYKYIIKYVLIYLLSRLMNQSSPIITHDSLRQ